MSAVWLAIDGPGIHVVVSCVRVCMSASQTVFDCIPV